MWILVLAILGPIVLFALLSHTKAWWVPGIALFATAICCYSLIEPSESHGSPSDAIGALGNAVAAIFALGCLLYGIIVLLVAARSRSNYVRAQAPHLLPVATALRQSESSCRNAK